MIRAEEAGDLPLLRHRKALRSLFELLLLARCRRIGGQFRSFRPRLHHFKTPGQRARAQAHARKDQDQSANENGGDAQQRRNASEGGEMGEERLMHGATSSNHGSSTLCIMRLIT